MPVDRKLLEILVCPLTKQPVSVLDSARLEQLNRLIEEGKIHTLAGTRLDKPLAEALVTRNETTVYPVDEGIPIMLEDESIPCEQIPDW